MLKSLLVKISLLSFIWVISAADNAPENFHLALTGNISEMVVSWFTKSPTKSSAVRYGSDPNRLNNLVYGNSSTYNASVGYNHNVVLTGLNPDSKYYYSVIGSNDVFNFLTGPSKPFQRPVVIPTYGDMGIRNSNQTMKRLIEMASTSPIDLFLHVGDISYADDYAAHLFEPVWNTWFQLMQPILNSFPYMVCPGNHESVCGEHSCANYTGHFAPFNHRFRMPGKESGTNTNMYQSWSYAGIHFVAVDTETDFDGSPEHDQGGFGNWVKWLKEDLEAVDRAQYPWLIVFGHRPIYSTSRGYSDIFGYPTGDTYKLQQAIEDILYKYKVDLFIAGHVHAYERSRPVYQANGVGNFPDNKMFNDPQAPIYIVSGSAGCIEALSNKDSDSWEFGSSEWSWYGYRFGEDYGYGLMTVHNTTHLQWQFIRAGDGGVEDEFWIIKSSS